MAAAKETVKTDGDEVLGAGSNHTVPDPDTLSHRQSSEDESNKVKALGSKEFGAFPYKIAGLEKEIERLKAELAAAKDTRDIVEGKVGTFQEVSGQADINTQASDTLDYIKECCQEYNLSEQVVKEIFDEYEHPFCYDLESGDIYNVEDNSDGNSDSE